MGHLARWTRLRSVLDQALDAFQRQGLLEEALELRRRELAIHVSVYGTEHTIVAGAMQVSSPPPAG